MYNKYDPLNQNQCSCVITFLAIIALLSGIYIYGTGCEDISIDKFESDPYLFILATEEAQKLTDTYGKPPPKTIYIQWCDSYSSRAWSESTKVIEINVKHQGNEVNIRWVIRHELRHLMWNNPSEDFANGYEP